MPVTKDLLLAILSVDSYNRSYGAGVNLTGNKVGTATILKDSQEVFRDPNAEPAAKTIAEAAGFYAISYDTDYGTVISYRGTDFAPGTDLAKDAINGWFFCSGRFSRPTVRIIDTIFKRSCKKWR